MCRFGYNCSLNASASRVPLGLVDGVFLLCLLPGIGWNFFHLLSLCLTLLWDLRPRASHRPRGHPADLWLNWFLWTISAALAEPHNAPLLALPQLDLVIFLLLALQLQSVVLIVITVNVRITFLLGLAGSSCSLLGILDFLCLDIFATAACLPSLHGTSNSLLACYKLSSCNWRCLSLGRLELG